MKIFSKAEGDGDWTELSNTTNDHLLLSDPARRFRQNTQAVHRFALTNPDLLDEQGPLDARLVRGCRSSMTPRSA